jgi:hypothetical protein
MKRKKEKKRIERTCKTSGVPLKDQTYKSLAQKKEKGSKIKKKNRKYIQKNNKENPKS